MAKLWTFSGINSPKDLNTGKYIDYVWERLKTNFTFSPDRRYASRLGTDKKDYPGDQNVVGLGSEKKLDKEAREFVADGSGNPPIQKGMFRGKTIKVLLVAPKTTTKPPNRSDLTVEVFWSPRDQVPNQSLIRPDNLTYWRKYVRGDGAAWPVENLEGSGIGKGHDFSGFLKKPPLVKRRRIKIGAKKHRYVWRRTGEFSPSPIEIIRDWVEADDVDYVLVGHSQGANIAMHVLNHGYRKP